LLQARSECLLISSAIDAQACPVGIEFPLIL
jgi:hypothetical protein